MYFKLIPELSETLTFWLRRPVSDFEPACIAQLFQVFTRFGYALIFIFFFTITLEGASSCYLPKNHPVHQELDHLFAKERPLLSLKSLEKAGFEQATPRKFTHLIVTRHPKIPGYIFKLYLDAQRFPKGKKESHFWKMRIEGAEKIRQMIAKKGWGKLFKVPHKWIYRTPRTHRDRDYPVKLTLLVEEDMELLSQPQNEQKWRRVKRPTLRALSMILKKIGLRDCAKPDNIPFCRDGKIAFIDTQTHGEKSISFQKLLPFLTPSNRSYWKTLNH